MYQYVLRMYHISHWLRPTRLLHSAFPVSAPLFYFHHLCNLLLYSYRVELIPACKGPLDAGVRVVFRLCIYKYTNPHLHDDLCLDQG